MPGIGFSHPGWLLALLLPLGLLFGSREGAPYPALAWLPEDPVSRWLEWMRRLLTASFFITLILSLAAPFVREQKVARIGQGAHIVLTIDRSSSMNENFSGRYLGGKAGETKSAAARKLLLEFINHRPRDLFAMVAFSTAPAHILSLTQDRAAIRAAIKAIDFHGRGVTNIAPGLMMALEEFRHRPLRGNQVILLVSDGGTHIEPDTQAYLRQSFQDLGVHLYWIYLRNRRAVSVLHPPRRDLAETSTPAYFLHQYFQTLGVPYRVFEADDPSGLAAAIATIGRLENRPLRYSEVLPRRDLSGIGYAAALILGLPLLLWSALEEKRWLG